MRWNDIGNETCSVSRALSVVGDRWSLLIIRSAFLKARRFSDFQSDIGLTKHRLSDRLNKLVEKGVFEKVLYQEKPPRYEYLLTEKGLDLYPIMLSLVQWGDRWMAGDAGAPIEYEHKSCGQRIKPAYFCPDCKEPIRPQDMRPVAGPALKGLDLDELRPGVRALAKSKK